VARLLRGRKERNLRIHVERIGLGIEGQKDAESASRTNCWHRCGIVCLFGRLAEGIWQYKWTGWVQIGKEIVSDWCDRKLSINLGMEKNFKI